MGATLFGVTLLQTYEYYKRYPKDSFLIKFMVAGLTILDTLHLVLCSRTIYWYLISNFNNPDNLDKTTWSMALQTDCNGIIGVIVEGFFARRVYIMSKNWYITTIIVVLAVLHFALGVVFTAQSFILGQFSKFSSLTWITCTGLGAAALSDIVIALSMCYYLQKKRTGVDRTDDLVTTLMLYSINTGLLTSIIATTAVIAFAIMPTNFVWLCFFWILGKCYVNSILASLNSRERLRNRAYSSDVQFSPSGNRRATESLGFREAPIILHKVSAPSPALAVAVQTTTEYLSDFPESAKTNSVMSRSSKGDRDDSPTWILSSKHRKTKDDA
ncbi:unnamed protein product [Somion occarium]|uniref:DUF6534 domain-containing protein n=1 Tax=Somion occarium TaxID=3059160 RepID=A0ABP1DY81_9APHY